MTGARQPIEAHILTGFLGAGKTTLLNGLLSHAELADTAVLINEFGTIGLDHLLVQPLWGEALLLKNGCICCTIRGDVKDTLLALLARVERGEIPSFSRLIIETTGLADPAPLIATFTNDPMLLHRCHPGLVITAIDVPGGECNLGSQPVATQQCAAADWIVLTKSDLAEKEQTLRLQAMVSSLNPAAHCLVHDTIGDGTDALISAILTSTPKSRQWKALALTPDSVGLHNGVGSTLLTSEKPIAWPSFALWLSMLLHRHGDRILRVKGLVNVEGSSGPVLVQSVQHIVHRPNHLDAWPDDDQRTQIIVIAEQLQSLALRKSFELIACGGAWRS